MKTLHLLHKRAGAAGAGLPSTRELIADQMRALGLVATSRPEYTAQQRGYGRALVATLETEKLINDGRADTTALNPDDLPRLIYDAINTYTPGVDSDTRWAQFAAQANLATHKGTGAHANFTVYSSFDDGLAPNGKDEGGVAFLVERKSGKSKIVAWAEVSMNTDPDGNAVKGSVSVDKIFFKQPKPTEL